MELERLIETEQRNDELVQRARDEAGAIVRAAREDAQQRQAALTAAVERLIAETEAAVNTEHERRTAEIVAASRAVTARYDAITDDQIARLVPFLVERLLADEAAS